MNPPDNKQIALKIEPGTPGMQPADIFAGGECL